jgi:hypothetical protein
MVVADTLPTQESLVAVIIFVPVGWVSTMNVAEKVPKFDDRTEVIARFVPKAMVTGMLTPYPWPSMVTSVPTGPEVGEIRVICGLGSSKNTVVAQNGPIQQVLLAVITLVQGGWVSI